MTANLKTSVIVRFHLKFDSPATFAILPLLESQYSGLSTVPLEGEIAKGRCYLRSCPILSLCASKEQGGFLKCICNLVFASIHKSRFRI